MAYSNAIDALSSQRFSGWLRRISSDAPNRELRGSLGVAENLFNDRAALEPGCTKDHDDLLLFAGAHFGIGLA